MTPYTLPLIAFGLFISFFPLTITPFSQKTTVVLWNDAAVHGVRDAKLGAPMVARALAVVHTCIYDV
jgi:hypothetical protein